MPRQLELAEEQPQRLRGIIVDLIATINIKDVSALGTSFFVGYSVSLGNGVRDILYTSVSLGNGVSVILYLSVFRKQDDLDGTSACAPQELNTVHRAYGWYKL